MLNLHRSLALILITPVTLISPACGDKDPGDESDSASSGTGDSDTDAAPTTGDVDPACACIAPDEFGSASLTCEVGPCGTVDLDCSDEQEGPASTACDSGSLVALDAVALDCALDQLIAGTPGIIAYHETNITSSAGAYLVISATGTLMRSHGTYDLGGSESPVGPVTLKPKSYFEGCKAETDAEARYLCFIQWTDDQPAALCDDASELSSEF